MVISPPRLYNYVIHIVFQLAMHHVMEYGGHHVLISCACIFQLKGHHNAVEVTYGCFESGFLYISWRHLNLIISTKFIHKGEHGVPCYRVYQQVHVRQREFVLWANLVEVSEIYAASYLPIFLLHWHNIG